MAILHLSISLFLEKQRYYYLSPLSETGLHAINVDRYFDRAVPLSFETRFLRIVGEALDTQPARPAQ